MTCRDRSGQEEEIADGAVTETIDEKVVDTAASNVENEPAGNIADAPRRSHLMTDSPLPQNGLWSMGLTVAKAQERLRRRAPPPCRWRELKQSCPSPRERAASAVE